MSQVTKYYRADVGVRNLPGKKTDLWWPIYEKQEDMPDRVVCVCPSEETADRVVRALLDADTFGGGERTCRVCGCSQFDACPGGCYWVEADLCSRCADLKSVLAEVRDGA